jgi:hypothetical protein
LEKHKTTMQSIDTVETYPSGTRTTSLFSVPRTGQIFSPAPREIWREILSEDPDALVTQTPEWIDSLCQTGGYEDASRLYNLSDGQRLLLPMARQRALLSALSSLSSFPNSWGMGGILSSKPLRPGDLDAVLTDLMRQPEIRFSIRPNPLQAEAWAMDLSDKIKQIPRLAHVLDLEGGFSTLWDKAFKSTARTAIRKAEKSGLVVEKDTTGKLIPVFYELFIQSLARWGSKQHEPLALARLRGRLRDPQKKFEILSRNLGQALQIWVAWLNGEPAAAIIVLQGKNASYTRGAMNKELAGPTRANDLLHRMAIEDACLAGCRYYHMGETGDSTSLAAFKSNFGAKAVPYAEFFYEKLPITRLESGMKSVVKKVIGFKDT